MRNRWKASAGRVLDELGELLAAIHREGWVWRDCKPDNLVRHRGRLWALDMEGACRLDATEIIPWGAPGYAPPGRLAGFTRPPGTGEDDYALGAVGFQFATGHVPSLSPRRRWRDLRAAGCPRPLADRIQSLLEV